MFITARETFFGTFNFLQTLWERYFGMFSKCSKNITSITLKNSIKNYNISEHFMNHIFCANILRMLLTFNFNFTWRMFIYNWENLARTFHFANIMETLHLNLLKCFCNIIAICDESWMYGAFILVISILRCFWITKAVSVCTYCPCLCSAG